MAYSYKGAIAFGLIYIPVTLHAAIKENDVSFHLLDKKTHSRIQYKKTCAECGDRTISSQDVVKGYEYEKGKYVTFSDEDFEMLKSKKDKSITIEQFIDLDEIDPLYYERAYYVAPTGAEKAFGLLLKAMEDENKAGIARAVMGYKQTLIAIRAKNGQMLLNTLYFHEEVQKNPAGKVDTKVGDKELSMAKMLIDSMSAPLKIEEYKDEYREKLQEAIESKIAGKEIVAPEERESAKALDLMEALKRSLDAPRKGYTAQPRRLSRVTKGESDERKVKRVSK